MHQLTVMDELVADGITVVLFVAVTVCGPEVPKYIWVVNVPPTKGPVAVMIVDPVSELVSVTESVLLTRWNVASTALTVTVTGSLMLTAVGVPVLPVRVLGALTSPGSNTCNWVATRLIRRKNTALPAGNSLLEMT